MNIPVIASGGAGALEHFYDAFTEGKADAVLAASLFHFGEIPIPKLKNISTKKEFRSDFNMTNKIYGCANAQPFLLDKRRSYC